MDLIQTPGAPVRGVQSHPAVLSGPDCLAGEAEIRGFLLEAEKHNNAAEENSLLRKEASPQNSSMQ